MREPGCLSTRDCSSNRETHDAADGLILTSPLGGSRGQESLKPQELVRYNWLIDWFVHYHRIILFGEFTWLLLLFKKKNPNRQGFGLFIRLYMKEINLITSFDSSLQVTDLGYLSNERWGEKQTRQSCWEGGSAPAAAHYIISYNNLANRVNPSSPEVFNHSIASFHWKVISKPLK